MFHELKLNYFPLKNNLRQNITEAEKFDIIKMITLKSKRLYGNPFHSNTLPELHFFFQDFMCFEFTKS